MMKTIRTLSRILVGMVFIFSGYVKAIDPLGFTYKFIDYFNAFHMGFMEGMAFPLAIFFSSLELVLGISLFIGYRMKFMSWILLLFMSFFTLLTFILALTNPVHDCGCFGDALILTNWETFLKNVALMAFTLLIFFQRKVFETRRSVAAEILVIIGFLIFAVGLSIHSYRNLPLIDFRPYSTGTYIPGAMEIPEGAPANIYETTLIYRDRETGKDQEFSMDDFPKDNENWEFVDAVSELVSEGYEPPIHDFNIYTADGSEITADILENKEYTFLLVAYDLEKADPQALLNANRYFQLSLILPDLDFYALTSSVKEEIDTIRNENSLLYDFCQVDEITLKTIVRANPGLVLLHDGTILAKWHYRNMPLFDDSTSFGGLYEEFPFCRGCNLRLMDIPPEGSGQEVYETFLYYRNLETGDIEEFNMDNFPQDPEKWEFSDSRSILVSEGYKGPLHNFNPGSVYGQEVKDEIFNNDGYSLIFFIHDPALLGDELFRKIQKLGGMASDYLDDCRTYALVPESSDIESITEEYLATFGYYGLDESFFTGLSYDKQLTVLVKAGVVVSVWKDDSVPDPAELQAMDMNVTLADAGMVIVPEVLKGARILSNKRLIWLSVTSLLLVLSFLGSSLNRFKKK